MLLEVVVFMSLEVVSKKEKGVECKVVVYTGCSIPGRGIQGRGMQGHQGCDLKECGMKGFDTLEGWYDTIWNVSRTSCNCV